MPPYHRVWLDDHEHLFPTGPQPTERNPEQSVERVQLRSRVLLVEDGDPLAQSHDLQGELGTGPDEHAKASQERKDKIVHETTVVTPDMHHRLTTRNSLILRNDFDMATHRIGISCYVQPNSA